MVPWFVYSKQSIICAQIFSIVGKVRMHHHHQLFLYKYTRNIDLVWCEEVGWEWSEWNHIISYHHIIMCPISIPADNSIDSLLFRDRALHHFLPCSEFTNSIWMHQWCDIIWYHMPYMLSSPTFHVIRSLAYFIPYKILRVPRLPVAVCRPPARRATCFRWRARSKNSLFSFFPLPNMEYNQPSTIRSEGGQVCLPGFH